MKYLQCGQSGRAKVFAAAIVLCVSSGLALAQGSGAGNGSGNGSGNNAGSGTGSNSVETTQKLLDTVFALRSRKAIGNLPGIAPFVGRKPGGNAEFILDDKSQRLRFRASMNNFWGHASYQKQTNQRGDDSKIFGLSFGSHVALNKQNVVGVVALLDVLDQEARGGTADSSGWLIGPYLAGNYRKSDLRYDIAVLGGQSTSDLSPLGTYTDRVTADRIVVTGRLSRGYKQGAFKFTPLLRLKYANESWPGYVDQAANSIGARNYEFTEVRGQVQAEYPLGQGQRSPKLIGIAAVTNLEEFQPLRTSTWYGSVEVAVTVPATKAADLRLSWKRDRIGDGARANSNVQFRLNLKF